MKRNLLAGLALSLLASAPVFAQGNAGGGGIGRAGSEMRHAMGIAVFFGMLGVTLFGLMLTPVFYVVLRTLAGGTIHVAQKDAPHLGAPLTDA